MSWPKWMYLYFMLPLLSLCLLCASVYLLHLLLPLAELCLQIWGPLFGQLLLLVQLQSALLQHSLQLWSLLRKQAPAGSVSHSYTDSPTCSASNVDHIKGHLLCKIHLFTSFIHKHVSPLCKEILKVSGKKIRSLFVLIHLYKNLSENDLIRFWSLYDVITMCCLV